MAVPRSKHTKSRKGKRRMHQYLEVPTLSICPKCAKAHLPHTICPYCGYYKDREVINVLEKLDKKERKKREKEMREREKEKELSLKELSKK